ncbi:MAG: GH3 auxin-responsive promoter family protein, partial [Chloroflexi bacterium]|nr:GH3 auxin-responsive promoter family protein [Chloroflexota bacterium]
AMGARFSQRNGGTNYRALLKQPRALSRLIKGLIKSKLARRPLLPKDIWSLKGLITFGIDGSVYREKIKEMWGRYPLDFHGCTEAPLIAMQTWDYQGMTFIPQLNFFEFIPEEDSIKSREDPAYQPSTLLLDELKPGNYELVITSLHGGPFIRYRLGHLINISTLRNEQLNIDIPQMTFLTRVDDQIDIAGFTRLSEKAIWQAIENTGLAYEDWTARKEINGKPALHLYIELKKNGHVTAKQVAAFIHEELKKLDAPYAELESFTGLSPLVVTQLPRDAFRLYKKRQQASGADMTKLKPPHINPSDETIDFLLNPTIKVPTTAEEMVTA